MNDEFDDEVIDIDGFQFDVRYRYDSDAEPPWQQCDGRGPVRLVTGHYRRPPKRPGERPMRGTYNTFLYDWQEAMKIAKRDKWGPGARAEAVQQDFEYLRAYVQEYWFYCGVEVKMALHPQYNDALWGVETYKDYHKESAREQARDLLRQYLDDIESGKLRKEEDAMD